MNNKKICFITAVNDEKSYEECLIYINNLNIPNGFDIEAIGIRDAYCMTYAYNKAIENTDAKYKIYLHQDTLIINKNFIYDMLSIFKTDKVGMIGVCGSKTMPTDGIWWNSKNRVGKIYDSHTGKMGLLEFDKIDKEYENVQAIDGLIMITQYDIKWSEELFDGWHFYDVSQCMNFIANGYEVAVAKQDKPWCIHDCEKVNISNGFEKYRNRFLDKYSSQIFPLVSVLIPTYNRLEFLEIALNSVLNQTYRNIEIIIGDDSTNIETKLLLMKYCEKYKNIKYIYNGGPLGNFGINNFANIYNMSKGEYVNVLMDDDIFHCEKIEKMMNYYLEYTDISLVTSHRQLIDENGGFLKDITATKAIVDNTSILEGKLTGKLLISNFNNFIGEPTTVLLKKEFINKKLGTYLNKEYNSLIDISQWLECCRFGNVVYIKDTLSYFRMHKGQNQNNEDIIFQSKIEEYSYINDSFKEGIFIEDRESYLEILNKWRESTQIFINNCSKKNGLKYYQLLNYIDEVTKKLSLHMCNICNNKVNAFLPYNSGIEYEHIKKFEIIGSDVMNFSCPKCSCTDRERHLFMYFEELGIFKKMQNSKILHIAPEINLYNKIKSCNPSEYILGDLFIENYPMSVEKVDITDINYNEDYFDIVICNHVLEHVYDDEKAMSEILRVLKCKGIAILQTPYSKKIQQSYQDDSVNTDELRLKFYGQEDHIRIYGLDFFRKLEKVGFKLNIIKSNDIINEKLCEYLGMNKDEELIMAIKPNK